MAKQFSKTNKDNVGPATGTTMGQSVANKHSFSLFSTMHFMVETHVLANTSPFLKRSLSKTAKLSV